MCWEVACGSSWRRQVSAESYSSSSSSRTHVWMTTKGLSHRSVYGHMVQVCIAVVEHGPWHAAHARPSSCHTVHQFITNMRVATAVHISLESAKSSLHHMYPGAQCLDAKHQHRSAPLHPPAPSGRTGAPVQLSICMQQSATPRLLPHAVAFQAAMPQSGQHQQLHESADNRPPPCQPEPT